MKTPKTHRPRTAKQKKEDLRVFHPLRTFELLIRAFIEFVARLNLQVGDLTAAALQALLDQQVQDESVRKAAQEASDRAGRKFARAQAVRAKEYVRLYALAQAHFKNDPDTLKLLDKFQLLTNPHGMYGKKGKGRKANPQAPSPIPAPGGTSPASPSPEPIAPPAQPAK